jgi:pimeloyl-ACP methyl ester carboxylesterase
MQFFPRVEYEKNNGKKPKMIFLAGFPDNQTSGWGKTLPEQLSKNYDLFFLCLPGYEKGGHIPKWGYSFDQLIAFLHATINDIAPKNEKYLLVCHDWGAFLGLLYQTSYPENISKLVLFDIGMTSLGSADLKSIFHIMIYQLWFCFSFIISQVLGVFIGTLVMGIFFIPIFKPLWPSHDRPLVPREEIRADKCYPYLALWKDLIVLKEPKVTFPTMPTFFMVGNTICFSYLPFPFCLILLLSFCFSLFFLPCLPSLSFFVFTSMGPKRIVCFMINNLLKR